MSQLKISEHEFVTSDKYMLAECETYFSELYSSRINQKLPENNFFKPENETVLDDDESASCEGLLTEKECLEALKNMEPDKTPERMVSLLSLLIFTKHFGRTCPLF